MIRHAIIGLPRSGKTTFLAALWHILNAGEIESTLSLDRVIGDVTHLNMIAEAWRRCEEVPRTSMAAEATVTIFVKNNPKGQNFALTFPDLSGESFKRQVSSRVCGPSYVEGFKDEGGILLFVTADRVTDGIGIVEMIDLADSETDSATVEIKPWSPDMTPEQVSLVELLQFLQHRPFERRRRRTAVVVSAWDVVPAPQPSPADWLERELPLLHQFLASNTESFEAKVFGVSAQGGDVNTTARDALLEQVPSNRVSCVVQGVTVHDLTTPIDWLMDVQ